MTTHTKWTSAEVAANSPLAVCLRKLAPAKNLYTTTTADIQRRMGYSTPQSVIAVMRDLQALGVIRYEVDHCGKYSSVTFRVLMDECPGANVGLHQHKPGRRKVGTGSAAS